MKNLVQRLALTLLIAVALPVSAQTFTINNLVVNGTSQLTGQTTGGAAVFTGQASLGGSAGAEALRAVTTASAVNWMQVQGGATGGYPSFSTQGTDANIGLNFITKGAGPVNFYTHAGTVPQLSVVDISSNVNYLQAQGSATGGGPAISAQGSDTNVNLNLTSKGTGSVVLGAGGGTQFTAANTASAVNYLQASGGATGNAPILSVQGSDTNAGITYIAKGNAGHVFDTSGGTPQFIVSDTPGATRYIMVTGSTSNPVLSTNAGNIAMGTGFVPSSTAGIVGTTTGNNANAGSVGEFISSQVLVGSAISLTTATPANVTSISLTAGDWDVSGSVCFHPASTTASTVNIATMNTTSATLPTAPNSGGEFALTSSIASNVGDYCLPTGSMRQNVSGSTTVWLIAESVFNTSTNAAYGFIGARRRR